MNTRIVLLFMVAIFLINNQNIFAATNIIPTQLGAVEKVFHLDSSSAVVTIDGRLKIALTHWYIYMITTH
jgi:hypothetical protein